MKTMLRISMFIAAMLPAGMVAAQEPIKPADMSEKALLAKARQLTQEELELSRIALKKAGSEKVKQFAARAAKRGEELDAKLTELAAGAGVTEPRRISEAMQERLTAIEKLSGEAFDPDYLDMLIDMQGNNVRLLEELARRADDPKLREFARDAAVKERAQLEAAQKLAAPDLPEVKPEAK